MIDFSDYYAVWGKRKPKGRAAALKWRFSGNREDTARIIVSQIRARRYFLSVWMEQYWKSALSPFRIYQLCSAKGRFDLDFVKSLKRPFPDARAKASGKILPFS